MGLQQSQRAGLHLTQQMQQALRLLQLSHADLLTEIQSELDENYLLELDLPQIDLLEEQWLSNAPATAQGTDSEHNDWLEQHLSEHQDYRTQLVQQLGWLQLCPEQQYLCTYLVDQLDDRGYLPCSLADIAQEIATDIAANDAQHAGNIAAELERALGIVQSLEPTGIGARSLQECLELQLREKLDSSDAIAPLVGPIALRILSNHLELLGNDDTQALANYLSADQTLVDNAVALIRSLHPTPPIDAAINSVGSVVMPELLLKHDGSQWQISLNPTAYPKLRLIEVNVTQLKMSDNERQALKLKSRAAQQLMQNVDRRGQTLLMTARAVFDIQHAYLASGNDTDIVPMTLNDVATKLALHESTISRSTSNKYLQTPWGVMPMRHFFSAEIGSGKQQSATAIKAYVQQLVKKESPSAPLSDQQLVETLAGMDIAVSRRTIAKYRNVLGIPNSHQRH